MVRGVGNALHAESAAIPNAPLVPLGIRAGDAVMPPVDHAWLRTSRRAEPEHFRSPRGGQSQSGATTTAGTSQPRG